jgi:hypothetical protein
MHSTPLPDLPQLTVTIGEEQFQLGKELECP